MDIECKHYDGTGCHYEIKDNDIWLCNTCNNKLRIQVLEQLKVEEEAEPMRLEIVEKMERQLEDCNCK